MNHGELRNVYHFSSNNKDSINYGNRCPALWFKLNHLLLRAAVNSNRNEVIYYEPIPLNAFSRLYYEQRYNTTTQKYVIKVFINSTLVNEIVNNDARDFDNVHVYLSDPWYAAEESVIIKDFKYGIF